MRLDGRRIEAAVAALLLATGVAEAQAGRGGAASRVPDTLTATIRPMAAQPMLVARGIAVQERLEAAQLDGAEYNQLLGQLKDIRERVDAGMKNGTFQLVDVLTLQFRLSPEVVRISPSERDEMLRMIVPKGMLGFVATSASAVQS